MLFATQANVFDDFKDPEFAGLLIALRSRNNEHAVVEADQDVQEGLYILVSQVHCLTTSI